jgi:hypothetical protein
MGAFKDKILDELYNNNYRDLYNVIDQLESDVEVANYLSDSRQYYNQTLNNKDLEQMPTFRKALYDDIKTGKVDYNKEFGNDWYNNFESIPTDQIKFVSEKQGVPFKELVNDMSNKATALRRKDISEGNFETGNKAKDLANAFYGKFLGPVFARRQQEAIARGEEPEVRDYVGDVGEQALYMAPWGIATRLANGGKLAKGVLSGVLGNATTPLIMEGYDSNAYGEDNPRGKFSAWDVGSGTVTNAIAPWTIKGPMMGLGRLLNNPKLYRYWAEFGNKPTTREVADELNAPYASYTPSKLNSPIATKQERDVAREMEALNTSNPDAYAAYKNNSYYDIAKEQGATLQDKANNYLKKFKGNYKYILPDGNVIVADNINDLTNQIINSGYKLPTELQFPNAFKGRPIPTISDEFVANWDKTPFTTTEGLASLRDAVEQEMAKNWATNEYGNFQYEDNAPIERLPFGSRIEAKMREAELEEQRKDTIRQIINNLRNKYPELYRGR